MLKLRWSKKDKSLKVDFPCSEDGALIFSLFSDRLIYNHNKRMEGSKVPFDVENIVKELESRGYDITTLKFEIKKKGHEE